MADLAERVFELKLKGYCCSQIIMALGLEDLEKENDDLIAAMGGLCNGLEDGKLCGALAAAVCLLYLADPRTAQQGLRADLTDWFYDRFGGYDCDEITQGNPLNKIQICPGMILETYEMLRELLGETLARP
jgi:hypothetical protein